MKKILSAILTLVFAFVAVMAESYSTTTLTAHTPANVQVGRASINSVTVVNPSAGTLKLKLFDAGNTTTNYTRTAYNATITYMTNYTVVTTNSSGFLLTNSVSGLWRDVAPVSSTTVLKPVVLDISLPANTTRVYQLNMQPAFGVTAVSDGALVLEFEYP